MQRDLRIERPQARAIKYAMDGAAGGRSVESAMMEIDKILETHGVEAIRGGEYDQGGFWGDVVAIYANMGDSYVSTILYDVNGRKFMLTSYGDFVERNERKYGIR